MRRRKFEQELCRLSWIIGARGGVQQTNRRTELKQEAPEKQDTQDDEDCDDDDLH